MRSSLAAALIAELDDASLAELARRLEPYLRRPVDATATEALLTPAAAAEHAGCHVETLRRAIRAGELPRRRSGRPQRAPRGRRCRYVARRGSPEP